MFRDKRWMIVSALSFCLCLGGCVYLRLLEMKNQLAAFDRYFSVEVDDSFILHAKEPVLYDSDVLYITELNPSRIETHAEGKRFVYQFTKIETQTDTPARKRDLIFTLYYNKSNRLRAVKFSPVILQIVPPEFLELSIRAVGQGKVNTRKRQLKGDIEHVAREGLTLPVYDKMVEVLGKPYQQFSQPDGLHAVFRHELLTDSTGKAADERKTAVLDLLFDEESKNLLYLSGNFAGMKISIKYSRLVKEQES